MRLIPLPIAGGGGRHVHINPVQVICLIEAGDGRTQIVTTGLNGESSISLIVEMSPPAVAERLEAFAPPPLPSRKSQPVRSC